MERGANRAQSAISPHILAVKKRLLIINGPLNDGGAERVLLNSLRQINYGRYDVDLALICRGGEDLMRQLPSQVNVVELWRGYSWPYKLAIRLSKWLHCNYLLTRRINSRRLHSCYNFEVAFLEGIPTKLLALRASASPKVAWVHADLYTNPYEAEQFFAGEEQQAYDRMDWIINVTPAAQAQFRRRFPHCTARLKVVPNAIDAKRIKQLAAEGPQPPHVAAPVVITIGRLAQIKRPDRWLQVAKLAHDAGMPWQFTWLGDGPLRPAIQQQIIALGLQDTVTLRGFLPNPYPQLQSAQVLLHTSDSEAFGLVFREASALGVPIVATPTSGACQLLPPASIADFSAESLFQALQSCICSTPKC